MNVARPPDCTLTKNNKFKNKNIPVNKSCANISANKTNFIEQEVKNSKYTLKKLKLNEELNDVNASITAAHTNEHIPHYYEHCMITEEPPLVESNQHENNISVIDDCLHIQPLQNEVATSSEPVTRYNYVNASITAADTNEHIPHYYEHCMISEEPPLVESNQHENNISVINDCLHIQPLQNEVATSSEPVTRYNSVDVTPRMKSMNLHHAIFSELPASSKARSASPPISVDKTDNREPLADEVSADMRLADERLKTFSNWPVSFLKPETLADNGFYYLNRGDEVRCAFCKVEIMRWEPGDDPAADHRKWAPQCPFLRRSGAAAPAPCRGVDECGTLGAAVRMPGPANPKYATLSARIASYEHWPLSLSLRQNPRDLADAGFFYTGKGDQTKCFYCDGGLKDWEDADVPWEQHARWFGRCAYVQLAKGRDYVQKVMTEASAIPASAPVPAPPADGGVPPSEPEPVAVEDEKLCKICYEEERTVCFVPCGHVVACAKCALATNKCPLCRKTFTNAVRIYFA